jgi:pimeloyl-ACP methyl ester carboxylesterase
MHMNLTTNSDLTNSDLTIEECSISLGGARMRYLRAGSGPPLILVHGLMGHSFSWRLAMPVFARNFTVYAVDMLGAGYSDRPSRLDHSLRANAQRLLDFLDAAAVDSCRLLGSSRGGGIVMRAAALAPERVERMVLVSPVNAWSAHGRRLAPVLSHTLVAPVFLRLAPRAKIFYPWVLRRLYGNPQRILPGTLEGYAAPYAQPRSFDHEIGALSSWNHDLDELSMSLPRVAHIPTLLLWGSLDAAVSPASAEPLRRNFQHCRFVMMEGVGHVPYEEVPDEFNRIVNEFLLGPLPSAK